MGDASKEAEHTLPAMDDSLKCLVQKIKQYIMQKVLCTHCGMYTSTLGRNRKITKEVCEGDYQTNASRVVQTGKSLGARGGHQGEEKSLDAVCFSALQA